VTEVCGQLPLIKDNIKAVQDRYKHCDLRKFDFNCFITAKHTTDLKYIKPNV